MKLLILIILVMIFCCSKDIPSNDKIPDQTGKSTLIDSTYQLLFIDTNKIIVTWQEKYGLQKQDTCIGIWFNNKTQTYELTWKDSKKILIEKSNINTISWRKVIE